MITYEELQTISWSRIDECCNALSIEELDEMHSRAKVKTQLNLPTYTEYRMSKQTQEHTGSKCFVAGCTNEALYTCGDARYSCRMCEEHARLKTQYVLLLFNSPRTLCKD